VLSRLTPETHPGLLGICLSGAGPTILALATGNFDSIAEAASKVFAEFAVEVDWRLLEISSGSSVFRIVPPNLWNRYGSSPFVDSFRQE
jgi:homoserine kinase